ncbi:MAG: hypothetical protein JJT85_01370 [Chromatiales bacterium]|nr:hypothetical protein [Chromatiales bacterium]
MRHKIRTASAALSLALLGGTASALPLSTASLTYQGTINFTAADGLSVIGTLDAQYRTPTGPAQPYRFSTSLGFGEVTISPSVTVTTPEFEIIPGTPPLCVTIPFIGEQCSPGTDPVNAPGFDVPLNPTIPLAGPFPVYDKSFVSSELPLGGVFGFDFGSLLGGAPQTLGDVVQTQFETGATTVSESGSLGPFNGAYQYEGLLQPGGDTILADYSFILTGPGLLGDLESLALGVLNENTALVADLVFDLFLATNPCGSLTVGQSLCNDFLAGLGGLDLGITFDSLVDFSIDFTLAKSIVPVPAPATLPLVALGLGLIGLARVRRTQVAG